MLACAASGFVSSAASFASLTKGREANAATSPHMLEMLQLQRAAKLSELKLKHSSFVDASESCVGYIYPLTVVN